MQHKKIPLAIDCDPGIDDAWALLLAAAMPEFDVRLLSPVAGNVDYVYTSENLRRLAAWYGLPGKLARGASQALEISRIDAGDIHGKGGMAGFDLPPTKRPFEQAWSWDLLYEEACRAEAEGGLLILAIGPLTNLALALEKYPDLASKLRGLVLMGGSAGPGNHGPYAEFNIACDPHAAQVVFESELNLAMVSLDVTNASALQQEEMQALCAIDTPYSPLLKAIAGFMPGRAVLHDALAAASLVNSGLMTWEEVEIRCECEDDVHLGQTIFSFSGQRFEHFTFPPLRERSSGPLRLLSRSVDREAYVGELERRLNGLKK